MPCALSMYTNENELCTKNKNIYHRQRCVYSYSWIIFLRNMILKPGEVYFLLADSFRKAIFAALFFAALRDPALAIATSTPPCLMVQQALPWPAWVLDIIRVKFKSIDTECFFSGGFDLQFDVHIKWLVKFLYRWHWYIVFELLCRYTSRASESLNFRPINKLTSTRITSVEMYRKNISLDAIACMG